METKFNYWLRWAVFKVKAKRADYFFTRACYIFSKLLADYVYCRRIDLKTSILRLDFAAENYPLLNHFRNRKAPQFHFSKSEIEGICSRVPPAEKYRCIQEADRLLRNQFSFRGKETVCLEPMDWGFTPDGDPDWTCDLNRHFHFNTLGFAYWYTNDKKYFLCFKNFFNSWVAENISHIGRTSWNGPFEVAARINAWIWTFFLFVDCPEWDAPHHFRFLAALNHLAEYLYRAIEYHSPGNHIILEAKALASCAGLFPEYANSNKWGNKAWRILNREARLQIGNDGVHLERSTMYHRIVAGELFELCLLLGGNQRTAVGDFGHRVARMADFEKWICSGNGVMPQFNDSHQHDSYLRFSANAIVRNLENCFPGDQSCPSGNNYYYWLNISKDTVFRVLGACEEIEAAPAKAYRTGGYFVSRSGWAPDGSVLVWDCGPFGYSQNLKHSHLDLLSIHLAVKGCPVLIDPGTEIFNPALRRYLRGTCVHNTVTIDGEDQAILADRDEVWKPIAGQLLTWGSIPECDVMAGCHNGYMRLADPVMHTRTIVCMRNRYWVIFDRREGRGAHAAEQRFHLAPGLHPEWNQIGDILRVQLETATFSLQPMVLADGAPHEGYSKTHIEDGVCELNYGEKRKTKIINTVFRGIFPFSFVTVITDGLGSSEKVSARIKSDSGHYGYQAIEVSFGECCDTLFFRVKAKKQRIINEVWRTDADLIVFSLNSSGNNAAVLASGATHLNNLDQVLISADTPVGLRKLYFCN